MPQPPARDLLRVHLGRARDELGRDAAARIAETVYRFWESCADEGTRQAQWAALGLLLHAASLRRQGSPAAEADVFSRCAEAFVVGWRDELTVQGALDDLDQLLTSDQLTERRSS